MSAETDAPPPEPRALAEVRLAVAVIAICWALWGDPEAHLEPAGAGYPQIEVGEENLALARRVAQRVIGQVDIFDRDQAAVEVTDGSRAPGAVYVNVYPTPPDCGWYESRQAADRRASVERTGVARYRLDRIEEP